MRIISEIRLVAGFVFLALTLPSGATAQGSRLAIAGVEIDASVLLMETEVTGTIQFSERPSTVPRSFYDLYLPVFVPLRDGRSETALEKSRPSLSMERRPVRVSKVPAPLEFATAPAVPGQTLVWWKARLPRPRRGDKLIVDFRYIQKNFEREGFRGFVFLPVLPDEGKLSRESGVTLTAAKPGTRLQLKSGKPDKLKVGSILKGRPAHPIARGLSCKPEHFRPIVVEVVAG